MSEKQEQQAPETRDKSAPEMAPAAATVLVPEESKTVCRNCGAALTGQFCAECGQKEVNLNPTMLDLVHEIWHELLHVDGKLLPSVRMLLTSPGALTLEHYAGRRARYISPMRLYLVSSILFFAIAAITPDVNFHVTAGAAPKSGWNIGLTNTQRSSDPKLLREHGFDSQEQFQEAVRDKVMAWMPRLMFLLVPLFAALVGLVERSLRWNYPRHLHFALHFHATWFLLLIISRVIRVITFQKFGLVISAIFTVAIVVYFVLALRRTYSVTLGGAIWRTLAVGGSYGVFFFMALLGIVLMTLIGKT